MSEISRRQWLEMALAAGGVAGLQLGCGGKAGGAKKPKRPEPVIDLSPTAATFDVRDRSATIWAFAKDVGQVSVELAPAGPVIAALAPSAASGHTANHRITGLEPDTQYRFRLATDKPLTDWHFFRTAPEPTADVGCRFLCAADFHVHSEEQVPMAFDVMRSIPAAFLLSLGDWPYTDRHPEAKTVEQYRERLRATRLRKPVRYMMMRMPISAIYDDHEVDNDWDEVFRRTQPERTAAGLQVFDEWFPTAGVKPGTRYRNWRWGAHCEFFMLDCRLYRSSNKAVDDAQKTILGAEQKAWLKAALAASTATFKIVISSIPLSYGTTGEHWNAFTTERAEMVAMLETVPGVLVLTGDQHWFAAHRYEGGLREFQIGPTQAGTRMVPPPMRGILARLEVPNFGDVEISPGPEPSLRFIARNSQTGGIIWDERFSAADLTASSASPAPQPPPSPDAP